MPTSGLHGFFSRASRLGLPLSVVSGVEDDMRTTLRVLETLVVVGLMVNAAAAQEPKVAIVAFDATPGGWTVPPPRIGETVAELMLDQLIAAGSYQIVDGQWLEPAGQGSRDETAMARLMANARAAGVEFVLLGSITRFSTERRHRGFGAAAFFVPLLGAARREKQEMVVSVMARIVEVRTGRVVASATGDGASSRTNRGGGGIAPFSRGGAGGFSSGSSAPREALLGEAIRSAVGQAAARLLNRAPSLSAYVSPVDAEEQVSRDAPGTPPLAADALAPECPPEICVG
jgi:curli biogenesis system outer membrane secretion channel CsgG